MAKICPMSGCREKKGLCIHDKMILGMMGLAVVAVVLFLV